MMGKCRNVFFYVHSRSCFEVPHNILRVMYSRKKIEKIKIKIETPLSGKE